MGEKMRKALVSLAAGAAFAASASVATADGYGSIKDAQPAAPKANWNGLYIGAAVGYGFATTDVSGYVEEWWYGGEDRRYGIASKGLSGDGVQGTMALGYDRQIHPGLLIGIFGDYTFGDLENDTAVGAVVDGHPSAVDLNLRSKIDNSWSVGARIGLVRDTTLWYAFAGYAQADLDWSAETWDRISGSETLKGYFVGLGVERQLLQNVSLKLEYRYTDYDNVRIGGYYSDFEGGIDADFRVDPDVHSVHLGVNMKFDVFGGLRGGHDSLK